MDVSWSAVLQQTGVEHVGESKNLLARIPVLAVLYSTVLYSVCTRCSARFALIVIMLKALDIAVRSSWQTLWHTWALCRN